MKLYEPEVLGEGITINAPPTKPNHGVRKIDLEGLVKCESYSLTNVVDLHIPKHSDDFVINIIENNELVLPNTISTSVDEVHIYFLEPQSGTLRIVFFGVQNGL